MELIKIDTKLDLDKALDGNRNISVSGLPNTAGRKGLIEEAILKIQKNPKTAFTEKYIGYKNYAGFGDQKVICEYGYGPKHGSVVYRIGRKGGRRNETVLGENEVYLLECVRDFGYVKLQKDSSKLNLCNVLDRLEKIVGEYDEVASWLNNFEPEVHKKVEA